MKRVVAIFALVGLALGAGAVSAQDAYPSRPITIVAPFPPASVTAVIKRIGKVEAR